jgi:hypothetical protein
MKHPFIHFVATCTVLLCLIEKARSQENLPFGPSNYEHDFQIFAPFDLDLDNMAESQWSGYFFDYNKLVWWYTGERSIVGSRNVFETVQGVQVQGQFAEVIFQLNPQDLNQGNYPNPQNFLVQNGLQNVPPNAGFEFGNRYEFGYQDQGHGWLIGILDGPDVAQSNFYGFQRRADGGLPPFIDDDYTDGTDIGPGGGDVGEVRAFGFGSVPVLFEAPEDYFVGFRDYVQNVAAGEQGVIGGPFLYVGNYGIPVFTEPNTVNQGVLFRRADDLNGNGIWGGGLVIDPVTGNLTLVMDYGDLHRFNVFFDNVTVRNRTEVNGVEAMWSHHLLNNHYMAKHQNNRLSVSWGARFLRLYDEHDVAAEGSILHGGFWDTSFTNQIVGPQVAVSWENQRQRWRLGTNARVLLGYNIADWEQNGITGIGSVPGALNQLLYGRATAFNYGLTEREFSPVGELRAQASYHVTNQFALKFGYTGTYIGNIRRAAPSVKYYLPNMGYKDGGTQEMLTNGFDFGCEFIY